MRAYALLEFDRPPVLTELPVPQPGLGEVRVRVTASSVNPYDAAAGAGFFRAMTDYRLPAVLGRDVAGTVDAVGEGVTAFAVGDEVFGMVKRSYLGDGTFAEYVVVPADRFVVARPDGLGLAQAGALGLASVTALQSLRALDLAPGDTVLVNGATGGVGAFAIQLAAAQGLRVVATARPGAEEEHVRGLGASDVVDWSASTAAAVRGLRPEGVDGVVDLVSRDPASFGSVAELARPGGAAVTTLGAARDGAGEGRRTANVHSDGDPALLAHLAELAAGGQLRVPLVDVLPLERIEDAFALLRTGPLGKVGLGLP